MSVTLYLFRHGQTEWSLSGQHTSVTDIPLTAQGEDEARALIPWINKIKFDHVFVSPRQRAQKTCELAGLNGETEPDLAEWNYGTYEGRKSSEIKIDSPGWNIFLDGCLGGESPEQVSSRADRLIARLTTLSGNVALFSHGHFGRVLSTRWIGLPVAQGEHLQNDTASMNILGSDASHPDVRGIKLWNATPRALG